MSTGYSFTMIDPCFDPREFTSHVGLTTSLYCEFEHESSITVTADMWSRQLPGGTTETFYSDGEFHADKDFVVGAIQITEESNVTATRFEMFLETINTHPFSGLT